MELRNKNILIFGGAGGIGRAVTEKFISEGAKVVIAGRNEEVLKKAVEEINSPNCGYISADIARVKEHPAYFEQAKAIMGALDAFVNAAGVSVRKGDWEPWDVTEEEWDRAAAVNYKGAFFLLRNAINYLKDNGIKGNILTFASNAAFMPIYGEYGSAKLSIVEWTKALGRQFGHYGIVINAIAPGATLTPMIAYYADESTPYHRHAIDRYIKPQEQGELAFFMMSNVGEVTAAQTISSDGGDKGHYLMEKDGEYVYITANKYAD